MIIMRRWVMGSIVAGLAGVALLGALGGRFLAQHIHGKERWEAWKAQRIAAGDRLDWKQLVPPEVPEADNFAAEPWAAKALFTEPAPHAPAPFLEIGRGFGNWKEGRPHDWVTLRNALGSSDLSALMASSAPSLQALEVAVERPACRLTVDYPAHNMPIIRNMRQATRNLALRASLALARKDPASALTDIQTAVRMAEHLASEPSLYAQLTHESVLSIALQPVWEGLEYHQWDEASLMRLEELFRPIDILASARKGWEGERVTIAGMLQSAAESASRPGQRNHGWAPSFFGRGWLYRNLLEVDQYYLGSYLGPIDAAHHRIHPENHVPFQEWQRERSYRKDLLIADRTAPHAPQLLASHGYLQCMIDLTRIVCALERHRMTQGGYPEKLDDLRPGFLADLPGDVATGTPLHYARTHDQFRLYSLGWNQRDDHGRTAWKIEEGEKKRNVLEGDWAWMHVPDSLRNAAPQLNP